MKISKILFRLTFLLSGFFAISSSIFAEELPFTDVPHTASYYTALKSLYDAGLVRDTSDHLFHPNAQIPRDEFVSIIVGVGCKQCLYPPLEDIIKYSSFPFIDVNLQNRYFYCLSYAKDAGIVLGYVVNQSGTFSCQNGSTFTNTPPYPELKPFCPKNNIERIEAVASLLRQANLWNDTLNTTNFTKTITITDIDDYWYGYAQKGIQAGLLTLDASGKVYPHEYITRKEFIGMSSKILETNQCQWNTVEITPIDSSNIDIFDTTNKESCNGNGYETTFSQPNQTTYDFYAKTETKGNYEYLWEFSYVNDEGKTVTLTASGQCLDNYDLNRAGKWHVKLTIRDKKTGKIISESSQEIIIGNKNDVSADIIIFDKTNPGSSSGQGTPTGFPNPYEKTYDFYANTTATGNLSYTWVFTNPQTGEVITKTGRSLDDFTFPSDGKWEVKLTVTDNDTGKSSVAVSTVDIKSPQTTTNTNTSGSNILIFDKTNPGSSSGQGTPTGFPNPYEKTYDFYANTTATGNLSYTWVFTNPQTGEVITKTGRSLDDFTFPSDGKWEVKLTVTDNDTGKSTINTTTVTIGKTNITTEDTKPLSVDIKASPLDPIIGTSVQFTSKISSTNNGPYEYHWNFGDGTTSSDSNPNHTYSTPGVYVVTLHVRDKDGNMSISQVTIIVTKPLDSDKDGILDSNDGCPYVYGPVSNHGCPLITPYDDGKIGFDDLLSNKCLQERAESVGGFFIGQATCTRCPCESTLDYLASVRACDILFPAITSLDKKMIFARGSVWQIKE